ncbi:MAG: hypothetical protein PF517_02875, partial [Salinivirgaceae bacterium]|nr:hypothetical protein [Salinivirgaceae bacterium]
TIISQNSPVFLENVKLQKNLKENFTIIRDSLNALSERTPYLGNHISDKVFTIEKNLDQVEEFLSERKVSNSRLNQRSILQMSNDLILLLSESLKNMENSSSGSGGGSKKSKNKPKQGEPSLSEMRKTQESIKSQLESMIKDLKDGEGSKGAGKSKQLAQMLAQQEIFQHMLNQIKNNGSVGNNLSKSIDDINMLLEHNKRDIINQSLSQSTLFRQNQIVTRLLEAENAETERDKDNKRKSEEAHNSLVSDPSKLFDEKKKNGNFNDILNKKSLRLNYYYQTKYQEYIKQLE